MGAKNKNILTGLESLNLNDITVSSSKRTIYNHYLNTIIDIGLGVFRYEGLPDTVDKRYLEMALLTRGVALFFKDEVMGYLVTDVAIEGDYNIYRIPKKRRAYAINGYSRHLDETNSVLCFHNEIRTNPLIAINIFADDLTELHMTRRTNTKAQKIPVMVVTTDKQLLSAKNLVGQWEGDIPFIIADKAITDNTFNSLNVKAPYLINDLLMDKQIIWNEMLTYFGIDNNGYLKKERNITGEVENNRSQVESFRKTALQARQQFCDQINTMFPELNVRVYLNTNPEEQQKRLDKSQEV